MPFNPTSPVSGAAISRFTDPTYTLDADLAPSPNGRQYAVTALGGTQTDVDVNSVAKPFTVTFFRPSVLKALPAVGSNGLLKSIPTNTYKLITRKGAAPLSAQANQVCRITTIIEVPAGCETYEPEEVDAMLAAHIGVLSQQADGIATTVRTGVM